MRCASPLRELLALGVCSSSCSVAAKRRRAPSRIGSDLRVYGLNDCGHPWPRVHPPVLFASRYFFCLSLPPPSWKIWVFTFACFCTFLFFFHVFFTFLLSRFLHHFIFVLSACRLGSPFQVGNVRMCELLEKYLIPTWYLVPGIPLALWRRANGDIPVYIYILYRFISFFF